MSHKTELADRVSIHALLIEYGASLDRRDFDAFGRLFGPDGEYVTSRITTVGPEAGTMMCDRYTNATDHNETVPNFHLLFNELIWFETADRARATSAGLFIKTDDPESAQLSLAVGATYEDEIVRSPHDGWYFLRREVRPLRNG